MSAFILNEYHLRTMVEYALAQRVNAYHKGKWYRSSDPGAADLFLTVLYRQNVRSVDARYQEGNEVESLRYRPTGRPAVSAVQMIKACNCYDYQACETDDYYETLAYAISDAIRAAAGRLVPGYEEASWVIDEPEQVTRRR